MRDVELERAGMRGGDRRTAVRSHGECPALRWYRPVARQDRPHEGASDEVAPPVFCKPEACLRGALLRADQRIVTRPQRLIAEVADVRAPKVDPSGIGSQISG